MENLILNKRNFAVIEMLTDAQIGLLMRCLFGYFSNGISEDVEDKEVRLVLALLSGQIDEMKAKYASKCERNRKNAMSRHAADTSASDGKRTEASASDGKRTEANASDGKRTQPNINSNSKSKSNPTPPNGGGGGSVCAGARAREATSTTTEKEIETLRSRLDGCKRYDLKGLVRVWNDERERMPRCRLPALSLEDLETNEKRDLSCQYFVNYMARNNLYGAKMRLFIDQIFQDDYLNGRTPRRKQPVSVWHIMQSERILNNIKDEIGY